MDIQTKKWPTNPVNKIILDLLSLPESSVIADVGCGDAKIAQVCFKGTFKTCGWILFNLFLYLAIRN